MSHRPAPFLPEEAAFFAAIVTITAAVCSSAPPAALVLIVLLVHLSGVRLAGSGTPLPAFALPCAAGGRTVGTS